MRGVVVRLVRPTVLVSSLSYGSALLSSPLIVLPCSRRYHFTTLTATKSLSLSSSQIHNSFGDESSSLVDQYDGYILDQFGVLHNGAAALDGAMELFEHLFRRKKKLVILSNTSAPSDKALRKLDTLGFSSRYLMGAVTSGDQAAKYIRDTYGKKASSTTAAAAKALFFTWDASKPNNPRLTALPQDFIDLCNNNDGLIDNNNSIQVAATVEDADFLLLHGSEVWQQGSGGGSNVDHPKDNSMATTTTPLGTFIHDGSLDVVDSILRQCLERRLPMVCANPDFVVQTPEGGTAFMPGRIAQRYAELIAEAAAATTTTTDCNDSDFGGMNIEIRIFGKPQPEHFLACLELLQLPANRVAHVGDSLHHDVVGASAAGIDSIWVTSGIHQAELGSKFNEMPDSSALERVVQAAGDDIVPTHIVPAFRL